MYMVSINAEKCEGCKECNDMCPAGLLGMNGEKAAVIGEASECMGCMSCVTVCPSEAIEVQEY
ncbi:MAG: 4Fe-4S dicluster domain-containing protein [Bacillota bacterium]